ncbi:hypothetical protein [Nannocystis pusilla]|uniref:hypothetical protein n=1 Tax=Nannocystis pusilla TaxID=889268 RepID=UPI003B7EEF73
MPTPTSAPDTAAVTAPSPISTSPRSLSGASEGGGCRGGTTTAVPCARAHPHSIATIVARARILRGSTRSPRPRPPRIA